MLLATTLRFEATLEHGDHGLRFLGPTLRGAFGFLLKRTVCQVAHGQCHRCLLRDVCPYPVIFEGRPPNDRSLLKSATAVPQPFILTVAAPGVWDGEPNQLRWGITLLGDSARWSAYVLEAFIRIGENGVGPRRTRFRLDRVTTPDGNSIWRSGDDSLTLPDPSSVESGPEPRDGLMRWTFHTPVHLRQSGTFAAQLDPVTLILAGRRRFMMLRHFFAGEPLSSVPDDDRVGPEDFRIVDASLRDWGISRFSGRQQRQIRLHGFMGEITITGPWSRAGRWIRAVEVTSLGKYATFGLGRVSWEQPAAQS